MYIYIYMYIINIYIYIMYISTIWFLVMFAIYPPVFSFPWLARKCPGLVDEFPIWKLPF